MNSALEILFQRRPAIDYVSPAICEAAFSSTGGPVIVLDALGKLVSITGVVFGSTGHPHRLSWNRFPGALCYSVYKLVDELDPFGPYMLVAECISDEFIDLDEEGTYKITAITPDGETPFGEPFHVVFPVVVPPSEFSLEWAGLDNAYDFADDASVIAGDLGGMAAFYKDGAVVTSPTPDYGFWNAVSPDGKWLAGDLATGIDFIATYDTSTSTVHTLGAGVGIDVSSDGLVYASNNTVVSATSGAVVSNVVADFPSSPSPASVQHPSDAGFFNNAHQASLWDIAGAGPFAYRWQAGAATHINFADYATYDGAGKHKINELGHVMQRYSAVSTQTRTFFYDGSTAASIGDFGGFVAGIALSNTDWVVGQCDNGSSYYGAFRWSPTHPLEMLPVFPDITPGASSIAADVNDDGWIVGQMDNRAFLFRDGTLTDLNDLIPVSSEWDSLESANFINNLKQVVGVGTRLGTPNQVFIMQLV